MAKIALAPGETFEHTHRHESTTTLTAGKVEIEFQGVKHMLCKGQTIVVPAGEPHVMRNVGPTDAVVACGKHHT